MNNSSQGKVSRTVDDELNIPLADEDADDEPDSNSANNDNNLKYALTSDGSFPHDHSFESLNSNDHACILDPDLSLDEIQEKERLIQQVLELQNTLDDLSLRVDSVKEENLKLKSENQVLGQYIENLMSASSVFQSTSPKSSKKRGKK